MPKITQYEPGQVQSQMVSQPKARVTPDGSGAIIRGLQNVAQATFNIKDRVDKSAAKEAYQRFEREKNDLFFNPESGYFNTQGRTAYDSSKNISVELDKLQKKYADELNPEAKVLFNEASNRQITNARQDIARHASKHLKAWELSIIKSDTEDAIENASLYWNDNKKLAEAMFIGEQSVHDLASMTGASPEETKENLENFRSSFASASVEAATQHSSEKGKELLEKYKKGKLFEGPDLVKLEALIERKAKAEKTQNNATMAVLTATRLVDQKLSRTDALAEIKKIEDPELRAKTLSTFTTQYNAAKNAEKEDQLNFYSEGIDFVNKGGTAVEFQVQNPEAWESMSAEQRNNLLNGKHAITDRILYNSLMSKPTDELIKLNAYDYADKLRPEDVRRLDTEIKKARKGQSFTSLQSIAKKTNTIVEQFFGKKKKWENNKGKVAQVQNFMEHLQTRITDAESEKKGKLSPVEVDNIINEYSKEYVIERSRFGFDYLARDLNINIKTASPEQVREMTRLFNTHGKEEIDKAVEWLDKNDKEVNVSNIIRTMILAEQQLGGQ